MSRIPCAKSERRHREAVLAIMAARWGKASTDPVRAAEERWLETGKGYDSTPINMLARAMAGFEKQGRAGKLRAKEGP